MNSREVTMVRIYCTESGGQLEDILALLQHHSSIAGVTVFRAMDGFGPSGKRHGGGWLDVSLDLPVTIEFFDRPEKVAVVLNQLDPIVAPGHLVTWSAQANLEE